jgi:LmbE family N-acetylglucosaminyl deacetylase
MNRRTWSLPLGVSLGLLLSLSTSQPEAQVQSAQPAPQRAAGGRTLLGVFAHPDDETMAGPLFARYARQADTTVYLAIATNGEKGVTPFAKIPAGEPLAAARMKEAACAARTLGAQAPILFGAPDGGLADTRMLAELAAKIEKTIRDLKPDAIVTWGPDGGYGHPDHRLVSALVTQVVQEGDVTPRLYYAALPKSGFQADALKTLQFSAPFRATADERLNMRVAYTPEDAEKARKALACHASQFTPEAMAQISALTQAINNGTQYLRAWAGGPARTDLFQD